MPGRFQVPVWVPPCRHFTAKQSGRDFDRIVVVVPVGEAGVERPQHGQELRLVEHAGSGHEAQIVRHGVGDPLDVVAAARP